MIIVLAALTASLAAADKPIKVETWEDHGVDFGALETFDFDYQAVTGSRGRRRGRVSGGGFTRDAELREKVRAALEARGYRHAPDDEVDFLVVCQYIPPQAHDRAGGSTRAGVSGGFTVTWGKTNDNSIYIELREPVQRQPIWRGNGRKVYLKKANIGDRLNLAVDTVVAAIPPAPHRAPSERNDDPN